MSAAVALSLPYLQCGVVQCSVVISSEVRKDDATAYMTSKRSG